MNDKEVLYYEYCKSCIHKSVIPEDDEYELCEECLCYPSRKDSRIPVNYVPI